MHAVIVSHAAINAANRLRYRGLVDRGVDVTVVVPKTWRTAFGMRKPDPEPSATGLEIVPVDRLGRSHSNLYGLAIDLPGLVRRIRRTSSTPTVLFVDEDPAGIAALQTAHAAEATRSGLVLLAIQNLFKTYPLPFAMMQQYAFARAATAVSISDQARSVLRKRGYDGEIVPMPFTTDLEPLSQDRLQAVRAKYGFRRDTVGYVGRLVPEKGVDVLLRAMCGLPDADLAVVGSGTEREELGNLAAALGIEDRVRFLGAMSPQDAVDALGALDVLALPSLTRKNWSEQFGRVLIEAMAMGVPVVASDSGAIGEVAGNAATLVPENDPPALAAALAAMLEPQTAERFSVRGRHRVATHFRLSVETEALRRALSLAATSN